ncbi:MAG: hypothetical protein ATN36_06490 [Epulopiscium sp. Nele67-Bin005]|nr:MAG: hypothetical protein ATN36_06490 [Epulopiscium sp. Nele67-Bin005]
MGFLDTLFSAGHKIANEAQKQQVNALKDMEKKIAQAEGRTNLTAEQRNKLERAKQNLGVSSEGKSKTIDEWDREWVSIGKLANANLTPYNKSVGLYRHVINGKTMYVGRAIELNNGGFRKRLSDYRRDSDSGRTHTSGQQIYNNLDKITTYILVVGNTEEAVITTRKLEIGFIGKYNPEWNKIKH